MFSKTNKPKVNTIIRTDFSTNFLRVNISNLSVKEVNLLSNNSFNIPALPNDLVDLYETEFAKKIKSDPNFYAGDMFHVRGVGISEHKLVIEGYYKSGGYLDHWLSSANRNYWNYLSENRYLSQYRFNGLSVCALLKTTDNKLIAGRVNKNSSFQKGTENIVGGNFQLNELGIAEFPETMLTGDILLKCAYNELSEEMGVTHSHIESAIPLVFSLGLGYKENAVFTYLVNLNISSKEVAFLSKKSNDEFSSPLIFDISQGYPMVAKGGTRSFALEEALKVYFGL